MRILKTYPADRVGGGQMKCVTKFDVEIDGSIRIRGCLLLRAPDGRLLSYGPKARGGRCVTFTPALADTITAAVLAEMGGRAAHVGD